MKATLKIQGTIELSNQDLFEVLKDYAEQNRKELTPIINNYIKTKYGYLPKKIQYPNNGLERIAIIIDTEIDGGARPIGTVKPTVNKISAKGFKKEWNGLYSSVNEIIEEQRRRKKSFISWSDLLAEMLEQEDEKGNKMFVKGNKALPMADLKQRLAPSQIVRASKTKPGLRGAEVQKDIKNDDGTIKKEGGLTF